MGWTQPSLFKTASERAREVRTTIREDQLTLYRVHYDAEDKIKSVQVVPPKLGSANPQIYRDRDLRAVSIVLMVVITAEVIALFHISVTTLISARTADGRSGWCAGAGSFLSAGCGYSGE